MYFGVQSVCVLITLLWLTRTYGCSKQTETYLSELSTEFLSFHPKPLHAGRKGWCIGRPSKCNAWQNVKCMMGHFKFGNPVKRKEEEEGSWQKVRHLPVGMMEGQILPVYPHIAEQRREKQELTDLSCEHSKAGLGIQRSVRFLASQAGSFLNACLCDYFWFRSVFISCFWPVYNLMTIKYHYLWFYAYWEIMIDYYFVAH